MRNGNEKFKTDSIKCKIYKNPVNEYELKDYEGKKFLVIKQEKNINILNKLPDYLCIEKFDNWNLVNSLIKLHEKMPKSKYYEMIDKFYIQNNKIFQLLENELEDKHIKLIIDWCYKYGLPFIGESSIELGKTKTYQWFGFENDMRTCVDYNMCGFRIGTFLIGIYSLYKTTMVAKRLQEINESSINSKTQEKLVLEDYIKKTTQAVNLHYEIAGNSKYMMYDLDFYSETILGVAMYSLQLWICSPSDFILKRCKRCNHHFLAREPRNKYCEYTCTKDNASKKVERSNVKKN